MDIELLPQCEKELRRFPNGIKELLLDAMARLKESLSLSMPLSRPMPDIGKGVHELRFKDSSGIFRIVYIIISRRKIYLVHALKKKTQKTPKASIDLARKRIKELK